MQKGKSGLKQFNHGASKGYIPAWCICKYHQSTGNISFGSKNTKHWKQNSKENVVPTGFLLLRKKRWSYYKKRFDFPQGIEVDDKLNQNECSHTKTVAIGKIK